VPTIALVVGWRWAFALAGALTAGFAAWLWLSHSAKGVAGSPRTGTLRDSEAAVSSLLFLTVGGFLGAAAATSLGAFLVDSAVVTGFAPSTAGWIYAVMAWGTVSSRIVLGWAVDRAPTRSRFGFIALLLAVGALGYALLAVGRPGPFIVGAAFGFVIGWAWTGIFHYAVVTWYRRAPAAATGLAQTGLSLGAGIGPLLFGIVVEQTSYGVAWLAAGGVSLLAALTVLGARSHLRAHRRSPSAAGGA
jgi:predicted MFS family arabinose efflux permease